MTEEIARRHERLGTGDFVVRVQWPGLHQAKVLASIPGLRKIFAVDATAQRIALPVGQAH